MPKPTRHRSAKSGKFVTAKTAKRRPATTVRECVKKPKGKAWWGRKKNVEYGHPTKKGRWLKVQVLEVFSSKLAASMVARIERQERNAANQLVPPSNWFYSGSFKCIH